MVSEILMVAAKAALLLFVVASMIGLGCSLQARSILQQLRSPFRLLILIGLNFLVLPLCAALLGLALHLDPAPAAALMILSCCAGAPFLPKLTELARGDAAYAAGAMLVLMVLTVFIGPVLVPIFVPEAEVSVVGIAASLALFMLLPLSAGLLTRARHASLAQAAAAHLAPVATVSMLLGLAMVIAVRWQSIISTTGSLFVLATALLLTVALIFGYVLGESRSPARRRTLAFATAQRNVAAAIAISTSLGDEETVFTLVGAVLIPLLLLVIAAECGRRLDRPPGGASKASSGT